MIRTKIYAIDHDSCYRQCRVECALLTSFWFYRCSHCIRLNRMLGMADSTALYPSLPQGSSNYRFYDKIMFASALMYGLLQLVKPFLHFTPTLNVLVYAGAWWDHLSDRYPISESGRCERIKQIIRKN